LWKVLEFTKYMEEHTEEVMARAKLDRE